MGEVVYLDVKTTLDIPPHRVVDAYENEEFKEAITIGLYPDGDIFLSTSSAERARIVYLLERAKNIVMNGGHD